MASEGWAQGFALAVTLGTVPFALVLLTVNRREAAGQRDEAPTQ